MNRVGVRAVLMLTLALAGVAMTSIDADSHNGDLLFWIGLICLIAGMIGLVYVATEAETLSVYRTPAFRGKPMTDIDEATLANMRLRVERCRRLARSCGDEVTAKELTAIADEGEADITRVIAEAMRKL